MYLSASYDGNFTGRVSYYEGISFVRFTTPIANGNEIERKL